MSATTTVAQQQQPEFHFPLPPNASSKSNHSRTFTGIEVPWPVSASDLTHLEPPKPKPAAVAAAANASTASAPRSPHRRHAHKRSGAVSQHDIQFDISTANVKNLKANIPSHYNYHASPPTTNPKLKSSMKLAPALVPKENSNNRSTSFASTSSPASSPLVPHSASPVEASPASRTTRVSFVDTPPKQVKSTTTTTTTNNYNASPINTLHSNIDNNSQHSKSSPVVSNHELSYSSSTSTPRSRMSPPKPRPQSQVSTVSTASAPPETKMKKHKRVKSWAGSLFRSRRKPTKQDILVEVSAPQLHSSSYIAALDLINCYEAEDQEDHEPAEPIIDLDDAENVDFTNGRSRNRHRRSESAPEFAYPDARGGKRKIAPVTEEETASPQSIVEEDEPDASAASSTVSLQSTASSFTNRDRGRYSRNYNSGLMALGLFAPNDIKLKAPRIENETKEEETDIAAASATTDDEKRLSVLSATISSSGTITPPVHARPISGEFKRHSRTGTITESHLAEEEEEELRVDEEDPLSQVQDDTSLGFVLGEPGPEVHSSTNSTAPSIEMNHKEHKSVIRLRRGSSTASFDFSGSYMKRRSLPNRFMGWVRGKVSSSSILTVSSNSSMNYTHRRESVM